MLRIEMIADKSQISADRHDEFDAIVRVLGNVRGPFSVLMHSPGLAQKVMEAGAHIRLKSTLKLTERQLAIIAVAREKDGTFEWAHHVKVGRDAGLTEPTIDVVRHRLDTDKLQPDERDIINYVRQLLRNNKIDADLFNGLLERHGIRWVVELTATIGQYQYITAINNAFEVKPGPDEDQLPV